MIQKINPVTLLKLAVTIFIGLLFIKATSLSPRMNASKTSLNASPSTKLFVDSSLTTGAMDGSSWANAFTNLSEALDSARICGADTICVAKGTYFPSDSLGLVPSVPQNVSFTLPSNLIFLGGFSPSEGITEINDRAWTIYKTILSGDLMGNDSLSYSSPVDLDDSLDRADNARHIINQLELATDSLTLIDGFYFVRGNAEGSGFHDENGGGIILHDSHPQISNCEFQYNAADDKGGAIYADSASTLRLYNVRFVQNASDNDGGAIYTNGIILVDTCRFDYNITKDDGGGIDGWVKSTIFITNSTFINNESYDSGGGVAFYGDSIKVKQTTFDFNISGDSGGGLYGFLNELMTVDSCSFNDNYSDNDGGGIAYHGIEVTDPTLKSITALNEAYSDLIITSSIFQRDTSFEGGAIFAAFAATQIYDTKFLTNAGYIGGAISLFYSPYDGNKNLFDNNEAIIAGGGISIFNESMSEIFLATINSSKLKRKFNARYFKAQIELDIEQEVTISNSIYKNNEAGDFGGAVSWFGDSLIITKTTFDSNSTQHMGGGLHVFGTFTSIDSSEFSNNVAEEGGSISASFPECECGALNISKNENNNKNLANPFSSFFSLIINNSIFQKDSAAVGGSISTFLYDVKISNSIFQSNRAMYFGGAVELVDSKYLGTNNLFSGNRAGESGGALSTELFLDGEQEGAQMAKVDNHTRKNRKNIIGKYNNRKKWSSLKALGEGFDIGLTKIINSTFAGNKAVDGGGAIDLYDTQDTIINCVIWDNIVTGVEAPISSNGILYTSDGFMNDTVYILNTLLQESNGNGGTWNSHTGQDGGGNIDTDPFFKTPIDPSDSPQLGGDFRVLPCSPIINAGDTTDVLSLINPLDLDGNPRVKDDNVDMGPYEFQNLAKTTIVYVDSAAVSGNNDGSSWSDAFLELYDALDAFCLNPGDTILVAQGTYYPDTSGLSNHRLASFAIRDSNILIGGFAPDLGIDSLEERDWLLYETIMSGDIGDKNDSTDNVYHIIDNTDVTLTKATHIDGFTLSGGNANGMFPNDRGGAIYNNTDSLLVSNCIFTNNFAAQLGGAILNQQSSCLILKSCTFDNNNTPEGAGGIQNLSSSYLYINDGYFSNNSGRSGGAIANNSSELKVVNTEFHINDSWVAGGAIYSSFARDTIVQCLFTRNKAASTGGAIHSGASSTTIVNSTFFDNIGQGGAVQMSGDGSGSIINTITWNNKSTVGTLAPRVNLGLSLNDHSIFTVKNNLIGDLFVSGSYPPFYGTDGGGNIQDDPEFIDEMTYDLRLDCASPAIDSGTVDAIILCLPTTDLDDSTRVIGKQIDIGAYEMQGPCQDIEVADIAFGEVCDTATMSVEIKSINLGDLIIDTIYSTSSFYSYNASDFSFPVTIPYCDMKTLTVDYNPTVSGVNSGSIIIISNAISGTNTTVTLTGTLDITKPTLTCSDSTAYLDASGQVTINTSYFIDGLTDNCEVGTFYLDQTMFDCDDVGTPNTVTITAKDIFGNIQTCTPQITILDTISPILTCKSSTIYLDADGKVTLDTSMTISTLSDNCEIDTVYLSKTAFNCDNIGSNTVITTTVDMSGNFSTCTSTITVVDTISPTMVCKNINVYLDDNGEASIMAADLDDGSSDNCDTPSLEISTTQFSCVDVGNNDVTLVGTDDSGNSDSCISVVTVIDTIRPFAVCMDTTIYLDADGIATLEAVMIDGGSSDACGIDTLKASKVDFTCTDIGTETVILTVVDNNGNISTCNAMVTIKDTISPTAICKNISIQLDLSDTASITAAEIDNGSSDSCGIASMTINPSSFTCDDIGTQQVTLTVTDNHGNVSTCISMVTISHSNETFTPIISGPQFVCDSLINLPYSVQFIDGVTYLWSYSGTGVTIKNNGNSEILLDLEDITEGILMVDLLSSCGENVGSASFIISKGTAAFCGLADCIKDFVFVSTEVLEIANSIDIYKVSNQIKSDAIIDASRTIIFKAGQLIDLHPPFEVESGAVFIAEIETCIE